MAAKIKHKIEVDGQTFTRNSESRVYSHVVVGRSKRVGPGNPKWTGELVAIAWASRLDLAERVASEHRQWYDGVRVIEVVDVRR